MRQEDHGKGGGVEEVAMVKRGVEEDLELDLELDLKLGLVEDLEEEG